MSMSDRLIKENNRLRDEMRVLAAERDAAKERCEKAEKTVEQHMTFFDAMAEACGAMGVHDTADDMQKNLTTALLNTVSERRKLREQLQAANQRVVELEGAVKAKDARIESPRTIWFVDEDDSDSPGDSGMLVWPCGGRPGKWFSSAEAAKAASAERDGGRG